jgi:hypothetical protein
LTEEQMFAELREAGRALLVPINGWNYSEKVDLWLTVPSFAIAGRLPAASIFRGPLRQVARYRPVRAGKRLPRVRLGRGADGGRAHGAAPGASGEIDVISGGSSMSILSAICSNRLATARNASAKNLRSFAGRSARH